MDKLNGCILLIEDDDLLENYSAVWVKVGVDTKKIDINLSIIKTF